MINVINTTVIKKSDEWVINSFWILKFENLSRQVPSAENFNPTLSKDILSLVLAWS